MKVVINTCYGGFGLSPKGLKRYLELKGQKAWFYVQTKYEHCDGEDVYQLMDAEDVTSLFWSCSLKNQGDEIDDYPEQCFSIGSIERNDPTLIQVVEELGDECCSVYSRLSIVDIEPGTWYKITEYDGYESIEYRDFNNEWLLAE